MNDAVPSDDGQGIMTQTILAAPLLPPLVGLPAGGARYEGRNASFWNNGRWSRALR